MKVFYCDHFELPLPAGHRFPVAKYRLVRERVYQALGTSIELRVAPAATRDELGLVHTDEYLSRVFDGSLTELEQRRIGFPWSAKMLERCRRSTGATIATARLALEEQIAVHLSGGTHHAFADSGQGFCVFNDIAVAAARLLATGAIRRALVIDLDVHQGNGTASIFADDARVFTFSMHGERNYPFRKTEGDLDLALSDNTDDETYLCVLSHALERQLPMEDVDLVFYLAGADPFVGDRMGRLSLTKSGLAQRDEMVLSACRAKCIPIAIVLAGGYAAVEDVAEIHCATVVAAQNHFQDLQTTNPRDSDA